MYGGSPYAFLMPEGRNRNGSLAGGGVNKVFTKPEFGREAKVFTLHPHRKSAAHARAADHQFHQIAHLRTVRLAAEISILVAALVFWGFLTTLSPRAPQWPAGGTENCVHLGRAGGYCESGSSQNSAKPDAEPKCQSLGRAGRFCPPKTP